jgi:hypothetical protein
MEKNVKTMAVFEIITGAGLLLFWLGFFTIGLAPDNAPPCYLAYEHSFPLPDIILAVGMLASAALLIKGKAAGRTLSLVCAGALIFLGVLDFSFNIQNGIYALSAPDLVLNAFINLWCVFFGALLAWKFWR